jgi:pimeloyl-ACP methyl ester carboxylesterase
MIQTTKVAHRTIKARDLDIFYREAGPKDAPAVLLLHGFPTSSQMFRNLIPALADRYRVLAPDYPGFGHNSMPPRGTSSLTPSTTSPGSSRSSPRCLGDGTAFAFPFPTRSRDGNHAGEPAGQGSKMSRGASDDDLDARYCP